MSKAIKTSAWNVEFSIPSDRGYRRNMIITVITPSFDRVTPVLYESYPEASVHVVRRLSSEKNILIDTVEEFMLDALKGGT